MTNPKSSDTLVASYIELATSVDVALIDSVIAGDNRTAKLYLER